MLEIYEKSSEPFNSSVDTLLKLTFTQRRKQVLEWSIESGSIDIFMSKNCPFLNHSSYVSILIFIIMNYSAS